MGTPGVPLNLKKEAIVTSIKNNDGRLIHIAKDMGCSISAMRTQIEKDPDLVNLLQEYRNRRDESLLNGAEDTLMKAIEKSETDMQSALKSSFFVLNNKGKLRGYHAPQHKDHEEEKSQTLVDLLSNNEIKQK